MLKLPWMLKLERRPRPLPQEFQDLVSMVDQLATVVGDIRKMAEATQRKVYRDEKEPPKVMTDTEAARLINGPGPVDEWRTGDPAV